jgi:hypothetical protein
MKIPTKYSDTIIHLGAFRLLGSLYLGAIGKRLCGSGFSEILIEKSECFNVFTVEALERLLFEDFVAAVIQIHNSCALEDINQALNVLAENQTHEYLEDVLANDSVIVLYKRYQEFKEDIGKGHLGKTAQF